MVTAPTVRTILQSRLSSRIAEDNSRVFDMVSVSCIKLALQVFVFLAYSKIINESPCLLSNLFHVGLILGRISKIDHGISAMFLKK